jgi:hypothetical protein
MDCARPQSLTPDDFVRAASFLGGASDKHGRTTLDRIQYLNRILRITKATSEALATIDTLSALIRDESGLITPALPSMPPPADELFVNYVAAAYNRSGRFSMTAPLLVSAGAGVWTEQPTVSILRFLEAVFGPAAPANGVAAFVMNVADAQRAIEFVHEYAIPVNLYPVTPPPPGVPCIGLDPFIALGGGTCCNGGWLPPGMACTLPPPPAVCTTPDPFVALGGGTCCNGGWLPPGMVCSVRAPMVETGCINPD